MDTIPSSDAPHQNVKLYTTGWIGFATYVGGPLAATYLISKNFDYLGKKEYARTSLIIGLIFTLLLFGALPFIPENVMDRVPNYLIPIAYTAIAYYLVGKYQEKEIQDHLKGNGARQSGWKVTGIAILSLIISMAYLFALLMLIPASMLG